jgi:hypothetical protein
LSTEFIVAERRSLVEGFQEPEPPIDPVKAREFVFAKSRRAAQPTTTPTTRTQLSSRIRTEFFEALKQASLKRQLDGTKPNSITEILEEALEPWLKMNGYLP